MSYDRIQQYKLVNLSQQLRSPTLVRVDINLPALDGNIQEDALRMRVFGHMLELYSEYAGLVVMSHQGRKDRDDFTSMIPHLTMLRKLLPAISRQSSSRMSASLRKIRSAGLRGSGGGRSFYSTI